MKRLSKFAKNIIISNFTDLLYPYRFTYILTYKCQLKCTMCNIWRKTTEKELSLEQIKKIFEKSNKFSWINLSGGEIFLRKDLLDIFKIIYENCKHLYLLDFPTNGFDTKLIVTSVKKILTLYNPAKLLVTVSLDGPPQLHDQIRNVSGSWESAVETFKQLRRLKNHKFNVFFGMTLQPSNIYRFDETFQSVNIQIGNVGYSEFHINLAQHSRHYYANPGTFEFKDKREVWHNLCSIIKLRKTPFISPIGFLERRYQHLAKIYLNKNKTPLPCQALSGSFFMDPTGNIYPCSVYDRILGNIVDFDYDICKLWNTNIRHELRKEIRKGNCPSCWTPCEAYQNILANLLPRFHRGES